MTSQILDSLIHGDRTALLESLDDSSVDAWRQACIDLITTAPITAAPDAAHSCFIEFGHRMREKLDDDRLLVSALRQLLSKFHTMGDGQGLTLYRGENFDRYRDGRIGLCWTPKREIAEMFGSGLNAMVGQGGVLLQAYASSGAVLAGPNTHSRWLGEEEHLVDPRLLRDVQVVARYQNLWT